MVVVLQDDTKVVVESVSKKSRMEITFSPIHMAYYVNSELKITVNDKNLFYFEVTRTKSVDHPETTKVEEKVEEKKIVDYTEGGHAIYEDGTIEGETAPVEPETEAEVSADGSTMPSEPTTESSSGEDTEKEDETGYWEETFGGKTDSKPFGPQSVGADITFHDNLGLYGLPQHSSSFRLKTTVSGEYSEPYRLFNLDVFEFATDKPSALYVSPGVST